MAILVFGEHNGAKLVPAVLNALSAAKALATLGAGDIHLLVAGSKIGDVAEAAAQLDGIVKVLVVDSADYAHDLAETLTPLLVSLAGSYSHVLAAATTTGKSVLPRLAATLDVAQISDIASVVSLDTFTRPIYAGNAVATVQSSDAVMIITVRAAAFPASSATGGFAAVETIAGAAKSAQSSFVGQQVSASVRPDLGSARAVVSGGRGMQNAENFKLLDGLADRLGAAIGASRAAVDSGFIPNEHQVGQTGKIVAPELYIAIGISGAIQHLAGMKDSKVIVAINKDEDAPIFQIADYGLVGDLFKIIPELNEELDRVKG